MRNKFIWNLNRASIYFWLSASLVWFASIATMSADTPCLYSPFSAIVVIPALFLNSYPITRSLSEPITALVGPILFAAWSFPLVTGQVGIPKRSRMLAIVLVILSTIFLVGSWAYGIKYQGMVHVIAMYLFNLVFWIGLFVTERNNARNPSFVSNLTFHTLFFVWLTWVAFPWLGELI